MERHRGSHGPGHSRPDRPLTSDVIVVGLGAMGAAATYQLAKRGVRVLGLDQLSPPHTFGSTHGDTRITRLAIGEGLAYVPLAMRSHELWREIEAATGAYLMTTTGGLVIGRPGGGSGFHHRPDFLERTVSAARRFGIDHEVLDGDAMRERFPQFALADGEVAYHEPAAGFVRPEAAVAAQLSLATDHGADLRRDERVETFTIDPRGASVRTSRGRHSAGTLVLAAGPWLPSLLHPSLARRFRVSRQVLHWFEVAAPAGTMAPERCPVYIWPTAAGEPFYGFPAIDGPHGGVKVATEQYRDTTDPASVDRTVTGEESLALHDRCIAGRMPLVTRRALRSAVCLYTTTPDDDFVIDRHPESDDVLIVSPCSGHGFKHSAAIGEAVAEMVTTGSSTVDLSVFSLARFAG